MLPPFEELKKNIAQFKQQFPDCPTQEVDSFIKSYEQLVNESTNALEERQKQERERRNSQKS